MPPEDSLLPFGLNRGSSGDLPENLAPQLREAGRHAYRQAWEEYQKAGCPFGQGDRAMIVWFSFNGGQRQYALTHGRS